MGLFSKFKDILFEEEEVTEAVPVVKKEEVSTTRVEKNVQMPEKKPEVKPTPAVEVKEKKEDEIVIDTFGDMKSFDDRSFPFQDFDEEEFSKSFERRMKPEVKEPVNKPRSTNVLEYERRKKENKKNETSRLETKESNDRRKFKPSPIISPVYGILHEDYRIEDIKNKYDEEEELNIDIVRKKAFEPPLRSEVRESKRTVQTEEPEEEKIQKVKTIDDLLDDASDEVVDILPKQNEEIGIEYNDVIKDEQHVEKEQRFEEDDTLENDLFDLIDSMYEQRKDDDF